MALGFLAALRLALSATWPSCSRVRPNSCMYRIAYIPIQLAGDAAPNGIRNSACPRARSATVVSAAARPAAWPDDSHTERKGGTGGGGPPAGAGGPPQRRP